MGKERAQEREKEREDARLSARCRQRVLEIHHSARRYAAHGQNWFYPLRLFTFCIGAETAIFSQGQEIISPADRQIYEGIFAERAIADRNNAGKIGQNYGRRRSRSRLS